MHAAERQQQKRVVGVFAALSVVSFLLFNSFSSALEHPKILPVELWLVIPFIVLLASIAVGPFVNRRWWEEHYHFIALGLGLAVAFYYLFVLGNGGRLFITTYEYVSFISLIGSLFVVSGGIHITIKGKASPWENVALLGTGAVLSNFLGTTGASMVLIRPYLRTNKYRIRAYHVVFFIFVVSNIGGALTPIGDPPLFLGYLKGVPFFWIFSRVDEIWALTVGLVLLIFFLVDYYHYKHVPAKVQHEASHVDEPQVSGLHNVAFLFIILGAVFIQKPLMVREVIMWSAALGSLYTTTKQIHQKNDFNFLPIKEVAILFAGIFATMIPALDWLDLNAAKIGITTPAQYYWGTGILSSFLDNAPTYLNFLTASFGLHGANLEDVRHMNLMLGFNTPESLGLTNPLHNGAMLFTAETWRYVQAVSLGAVFFGAMTYIGNGPNFMVKSISEQMGVDCPSFFGYIIKYSIPVLLPVFALVWFLFLRT